MYSSTSGWRWTSTNSGGGKAAGLGSGCRGRARQAAHDEQAVTPGVQGQHETIALAGCRERQDPDGRGTSPAGTSPTNRPAIAIGGPWTRPFPSFDRLGLDDREVGEGHATARDDLHLHGERFDHGARHREKACPERGHARIHDDVVPRSGRTHDDHRRLEPRAGDVVGVRPVQDRAGSARDHEALVVAVVGVDRPRPADAIPRGVRDPHDRHAVGAGIEYQDRL